MMSPVPDDPGKNDDQREIESIETPQMIINVSEESDDEGYDAYQGYQPLSQDPESAVPVEYGTVDDESEPAANPEIDQVIMQSMDSEDFMNATVAQTVDEASPSESASLWNEPRTCRTTLPLDQDQQEQIRAAMSGFSLPESSHPDWARTVPEEEWKSKLLSSLSKSVTKKS